MIVFAAAAVAGDVDVSIVIASAVIATFVSNVGRPIIDCKYQVY